MLQWNGAERCFSIVDRGSGFQQPNDPADVAAGVHDIQRVGVLEGGNFAPRSRQFFHFGNDLVGLKPLQRDIDDHQFIGAVLGQVFDRNRWQQTRWNPVSGID